MLAAPGRNAVPCRAPEPAPPLHLHLYRMPNECRTNACHRGYLDLSSLGAAARLTLTHTHRFWCLLIVAAYVIAFRVMAVLALRYVSFLRR